jgi:nucleoside-diphosphate-sugar epimerase
MSTLVCLGLGYSARYYVAEFGGRFTRIIGTSRSADQANGPRVQMIQFDGATPSVELREAVKGSNALLISAAPGPGGDPILNALGADIKAAPQLQSIVYLSSLGVYGDHGGAWVDETTPTIPPHTRGAARANAELGWQQLGRQRAAPVAILRLGGIYGPGQNAFTRLLAGRAHRIAKPGHVTNRIHVADIAQAIEAAFAQRADGIFNVNDDEPAPPGDQITFAANLLGVEPPRELSMEEATRTLPPFVMSFYQGFARVRNDKLKNVLGVKLRYPNYRIGLQALFDAGYEARDPLA